MTRSFLFVPADSERKFARAVETDADALILDLEDSVAPARKAAAREHLGDFLASRADTRIWVRINPLSSKFGALDLAALGNELPYGIVLPKCGGAEDIQRLDGLLSDLERAVGVDPGATRILPLVTETPAAMFAVQEYASVRHRLDGLTWGAEDLAAAIGAATNKDESGQWLDVFALARSLCLLGAAAAEVPAIETVYTRIRDVEGAKDFAEQARRDGFSGMLVLHPAQIDVVNEAFTPSSEEIERARQIVALFDADPDAGVSVLDGEMVDRPHYLQAQRILGVADRLAAR